MAIILIVDDQSQDRKQVSRALTAEGYGVATIADAAAIWKNIRKLQPSIVLLNSLSDQFDSFKLLMDIKREYSKLPVLVYVIKSFDAIDRLKEAIADVLDKTVWLKRTRNSALFAPQMHR